MPTTYLTICPRILGGDGGERPLAAQLHLPRDHQRLFRVRIRGLGLGFGLGVGIKVRVRG